MAISPVLRIRSTLVGEGERVFVLEDRPVTIGRGEECDIVLLEQAASREHARVEPTDDGFAIVDLGSVGGVFVGGRRVKRQVLSDGDAIAIGDTTLTFVLSPQSQPTFVGSTGTAPGVGPVAARDPGDAFAPTLEPARPPAAAPAPVAPPAAAADSVYLFGDEAGGIGSASRSSSSPVASDPSFYPLDVESSGPIFNQGPVVRSGRSDYELGDAARVSAESGFGSLSTVEPLHDHHDHRPRRASSSGGGFVGTVIAVFVVGALIALGVMFALRG
jgi:pSer/pThr/pTyr-binding forkhead associated (FHA) protein